MGPGDEGDTVTHAGPVIADAKVIGRYTLYDPISSGGMGQVHFARLKGASGFERTVAIKHLHPQYASDPEFTTMLLDEARLAARIHHPNVVGTLDVVAEGGEIFLVMEYVRGEALGKLVRTSSGEVTRPPVGCAVAILVGVLHGLHAAHEATSAQGEPLGVVHRDVSPQNVLVGEDGVARVIDFGIAKAVERVHVTRGDELRGKIAYMAPEQLSRGAIDRRADIYAASVVLWEMLAGQRMVDREAERHPALMMEALRRDPAPPSSFERAREVPRALDDVVLRGLARKPTDRFATALEMATALECALVPASQREVGEWVSRTAGETLRRRQQLLRRIETDPGVPSKEGKDEVARPSTPSVSGLASTAAHVRAPTRTTSRLVALSAVLALGLAWAAGAIYGKSSDRDHKSAASATAGSGSAVAEGHGGSEGSAATTQATPQGAMAAPVAAAPADSEGNPALELASSAGAAPASRRAAPGRAKRSSCSPPYRIENGIKVVKVECL